VSAVELTVGESRLVGHLGRPPGTASRGTAGVVVAHAISHPLSLLAEAWGTFPELADRIARESGWPCLTFGFRGLGGSSGRPSPATWRADLVASVEWMRGSGWPHVWLAGFGLGGTLAVSVGGSDQTVRGVAALAAYADLSTVTARAGWVGEGDGAADSGEAESWAHEIAALDPLVAAAQIPPRPFLVAHGSADEVVAVEQARALAEAAGGRCELHVIPMAGHALRHDPRAVALLLGWLLRQAG